MASYTVDVSGAEHESKGEVEAGSKREAASEYVNTHEFDQDVEELVATVYRSGTQRASPERFDVSELVD